MMPYQMVDIEWDTDNKRTFGSHRIVQVNLEKILNDEKVKTPQNNLLNVLTVRLNDLLGEAMLPDWMLESIHLRMTVSVRVRASREEANLS